MARESSPVANLNSILPALMRIWLPSACGLRPRPLVSIARMIAAGLPIGAGTDATRVASYNPWVSLSWLITGRTVADSAHLAQSVADILTTPIGTRVMRREYGSQLPDLVDWPTNPATRLLAYAATAMALMRWEPRIRLSRVELFLGDRPGQAVLDQRANVAVIAALGRLQHRTVMLAERQQRFFIKIPF